MLGLQEAGYALSVPFGENLRYDLTVDDGERILRVQCKTGRLRDGTIRFATCSCYGHHRNVVETRRDYAGQIDAFGVYCPETGGVYLVPIDSVPTKSSFWMRVAPTRNGQRAGTHWAINYLIAEVDVIASGPEQRELAA